MELDDFLADQAQEGQRHSRGQFEIDLDRAAGQLSQFQLADAGRYLLKAVQAMIGWNCTSISIQLDKKQARLSAAFAGKTPEPKMLIQPETLLSELLRGGDSPERDLSMAVRGALALRPERIFLIREEGLLRQRLELREGKVWLHDEAGQDDAFKLELVVAGGERSLLLEENGIRQRCSYASVPIKLGSYKVNASSWGPPLASHPDLAFPPGFYLVERYLVDPALGRAGLPCLRRGKFMLQTATRGPTGQNVTMPGKLPKDETAVRSFLREDIILSESAEDSWELPGDFRPAGFLSRRVQDRHPMCRALLAISATLQPESVLMFVKNGVLLDKICTIALPIPGCLALVSGADLKVDLSQFKIVEDDNYFRQLRYLDGQLRSMWADMLANADRLRPPPQESGMLGITGGVLGAFTLHPAVIVIGYRLGKALESWLAGRSSSGLQKKLKARAASIQLAIDNLN